MNTVGAGKWYDVSRKIFRENVRCCRNCFVLVTPMLYQPAHRPHFRGSKTRQRHRASRKSDQRVRVMKGNKNRSSWVMARSRRVRNDAPASSSMHGTPRRFTRVSSKEYRTRSATAKFEDLKYPWEAGSAFRLNVDLKSESRSSPTNPQKNESPGASNDPERVHYAEAGEVRPRNGIPVTVARCSPPCFPRVRSVRGEVPAKMPQVCWARLSNV